VFSSDGDGSLSFEDFLDLYSTFSEQASRDVKTTFAFKIYDFDNDGLIGKIRFQKSLFRLGRWFTIAHSQLNRKESHSGS
jgi:calcium and integrin-binding protein 1